MTERNQGVLRLVGRGGGDDEMYLGETEQPQGPVGDVEVSKMNRIEGAAQDSHSHADGSGSAVKNSSTSPGAPGCFSARGQDARPGRAASSIAPSEATSSAIPSPVTDEMR